MIIQRVFNFSGGKTSAAMTIEEYKPGDIVLFTDTTREEKRTYKFIDDFEKHENIPVTRITFGFGGLSGFDAMYLKEKYKRIPNRMLRSCTEELKINTAKRYLKSIGITRFENFIGFRADEPLRVNRHKEKFKKVTTRFPLYEKGITKQMIDKYWSEKPYTLEIPSILGNCTLCFMKGKNAIISILKQHPELAEPWIKDEEESKKQFGHTYFKGTTIKELLSIAQSGLLIKDYDLNKVEPSFNCACSPS